MDNLNAAALETKHKCFKIVPRAEPIITINTRFSHGQYSDTLLITPWDANLSLPAYLHLPVLTRTRSVMQTNHALHHTEIP